MRKSELTRDITRLLWEEEKKEEEEKKKKELEEEQEEEEEIIVEYGEIEYITTHYKLALISLKKKFPSKITARTNRDKEIKIRIYEWVSIDDYDENLGEYSFEPIIDTDYKIDEELKAPLLKVYVDDESEGPTGLIDDSHEVPSAELTGRKGLLRSSASETYYNGYENGYLPEIRNQGKEGACWAFATLAAVEMDLIKKGMANTDVDLSELQLAYYTAHNYDDPKNCHDNDTYTINGAPEGYLSNGGNYSISSIALMNKVGAVEESYVPYTKGASYTPDEKYAVSRDYAQVTDVYEININDRDLIKEAIKEHGAVGAAFYASTNKYFTDSSGNRYEEKYSATHNSYYGTVYQTTNHAVALVGWNDNFSKDNFYDGLKPEGNGAWLVRNSWGLEDYGMNGYFWLSYYDASLLHSGSVTVFSATTNMYDNVYSYWTGVDWGEQGYGGNSYTATTQFTIMGGETIKAVAVATANPNGNIKVTVKAGDRSSSGEYYNQATGTYTVELDNPMEIEEDTEVTVEYTITPSEGDTPIILSETHKTKERKNIIHYVALDKGFSINGHEYGDDPRIMVYTDNGVSGSMPVVSGKLKVSTNGIYDHAGETHQIELTDDSVVTDPSLVVWTAIDENVATVDVNGLITVGSKKGKTAIVGTYTDSATGKEYEVSLIVMVKPYNITYVLGDDVSYTQLYTTYYPGDASNCILPEQWEMCRQGYLLDYWCTDESLETEVNTETLVGLSGDLTLYPKWFDYYVTLKYYVPNSDLSGYTEGKLSIKSELRMRDIPYTMPNAKKTYYNPNDYVGDTGMIFSYWSMDPEGQQPVTTLDKNIYITTKDSATGYYSTNYREVLTFYPQYVVDESIKVSFDANGGSVSASTLSLFIGEKYGALPTPSRTGYDFAGWHLNSADGELITSTSVVTTDDNHVLVAAWTGKEYIVTFDAKGGTSDISSKQVVYKETYGSLPIPTKDGYVFVGWYDGTYSSSKEIKSDTVYTNTANKTIYARWQAATYTVIFDANGGTCATTSKSVTYNSQYGSLPSPTKTGYSFKAWHLDSIDGKTITYNLNVSETRNHILVAEYSAELVKVNFFANGGKVVSPSNKNVYFDSPYGSPLPIPTRSGYSFTGWHLGSAVGDLITSESIVQTATTHTLYASWTPSVYTVTFNANGGTCDPASMEIEYSSAYGELPIPKRTGYSFVEWRKSNASGTVVTSTTKYYTADDSTLYAVWKVNSYLVTYDAGEGYLPSGLSKYVNYGANYGALQTPTRTGYFFVAWHLNTIDGEVITPSSVMKTAAEHKLVAEWDELSYLTITLDSMGGSCDIFSISKLYGDYYGDLPYPTREGYRFAGWSPTNDQDNTVYAFSIVDINSNHTLYAVWFPEVYYINFDTNGGYLDNNYTYGRYEVYYEGYYGELPTPVKPGYSFDGWRVNSIDGPVVSTYSTVSIASNHKLVASWSGAKYNIYLDLDDGELVNPSDVSRIISYGDAIGSLPTPTKTGHVFVGWYYDANYESEVKTTDLYLYGGDKIIYALWSKVQIVDAPEFEVLDTTNPDLRSLAGLSDDTYGTDSVIYITTKTNGASIYYTTSTTIAESGYTDSNKDSWTKYLGGIKINVSNAGTYYAVAVRTGWNDSTVVSKTVNIQDLAADATLIANMDDRQEYLINPRTGIWVAGIRPTTFVYNGVKFDLKPDVDFRVYDGVVLLKNKVDYTYSLKNNTNAGTVTITVTGKGDYVGVYAENFTIEPRDFSVANSDIEVVLNKGEFYQAGNALVKPAVTVKDIRNNKSVNLANNKEYVLEYFDYDESLANPFTTLSKDAGKKAIRIMGKGNYSPDSRVAYYHVVAKERLLNNASITSVDVKDVKIGNPNQVGNVHLKIKINGKVYDETELDSYNCDVSYKYLDIPESVAYDYRNDLYSPGNYLVTISGDGVIFSGIITKKFSLAGGKNITSVKMELPTNQKLNNLIYDDGKVIDLDYEFNDSGYSLVEGGDKDYIIVRANGAEIGNYTDVIYGIGKYKGVKKVTYQIKGIPLSTKFKVTFGGVEKNPTVDYINKPYKVKESDEEHLAESNLAEDKLDIKVSNGDTILVMDKDYEVQLPKDMESVGVKNITFIGKGKYTGKITKSLKILPFDVDADRKKDKNERIMSFRVDEEVAYVKGGVKQIPKVIVDGQELPETFVKENFTISWSNNTGRAAKDASDVVTVWLAPKKNHSGKKFPSNDADDLQDFQYIIKKGDIGDTIVTVADKVYANRNGIYKSAPTLKDATTNTQLRAGTDYEALKDSDYTYAEDVTVTRKVGKNMVVLTRVAGTQVDKNDIIPVGAVIHVAITGKGDYAGSSTEVTYRFLAANMSSAKVQINIDTEAGMKLKSGYEYSGNSKTIPKEALKVTINNGKILLTNDDYDIVAYTNNIKKGRATVTLRGKGNYGGLLNYTFTINSKNMKYTIVYDKGGFADSTKVMKNSSTANLATMSANGFGAPVGYQFSGWTLTPHALGDRVAEDEIYFAAVRPTAAPILNVDNINYPTGSTVTVYAYYVPK